MGCMDHLQPMFFPVRTAYAMPFLRTLRQLKFAAACLLAAWLPLGASAAAGNLVIGAAVLSKSNCKFANPASETISFGTIDPTLSTPQSQSVSFTFTCKGSAAVAIYDISDNGGQNFAGGNRMRHATTATEYLPYTLTLTPNGGSAAKNVAQIMTATVTIPVASFQQAIAGAFSDTVIITINP